MGMVPSNFLHTAFHLRVSLREADLHQHGRYWGSHQSIYAGAQWDPICTLESLLWPLCEAASVAVGRPVGTDVIGRARGLCRAVAVKIVINS